MREQGYRAPCSLAVHAACVAASALGCSEFGRGSRIGSENKTSTEPRSTVTATAECRHGLVALFSWDYDGNLVDASRKRRARSSAQAVWPASSAMRSWRISNSTCGFPRRSPYCTIP